MFAYVFEARSIQSWILQGGRLADMVAASDIVDQLCGRVLDDALEALGLEEGESLRLARRAGGAIHAVAEERAVLDQLRDMLALVVPAFAPGLEFIHAVEAGKSDRDALQAALDALLALRNRPAARFPQTGPLVEREPRSGEPAVAFVRSGAVRKQGAIGAATRAKRDPKQSLDALSSRFIPPVPHEQADWVWPRNMETDADEDGGGNEYTFPFVGEQNTVGIIHADGNGLGQILLKLQDAVKNADEVEYVALFRDFSDLIERATRRAAQLATESVLMPNAVESRTRYGRTVRTLPARPLVLGGDDLSIIVRSDLALPYARAFVEAFADCTREALSAWHADARWASLFATAAGKLLAGFDHMTACAGIALVRASQPFEMAYELAESLCQRAKAASGRVQGDTAVKPASLVFYRLTNSLVDDPLHSNAPISLDVAHKQDMLLRLHAYGLAKAKGCDAGLPSLDALESLARLLRDEPGMATGGLRQLLTTLQEDSAAAPAQYRRWRQMRSPALLARFDAALAALGTPDTRYDLPLLDVGKGEGEAITLACPLEDVFDLLAVAQPATTKEAGQ